MTLPLSSRSALRGSLLIGQSGGATAVINASLVGAVREAFGAEAIDNVYGMLNGVRGLLDHQMTDLRQEPGAIWERLLHTPSAALGSCRYRLREGDAARIVEDLRALNIRYFLYIGGNDSADTAHQVSLAAHALDYELRVIAIPKTIDNDLPDTDHCPGYGSAARFIAQATIDSALCTTSMPDHYPVKIIEVMGRDAGWLAAASALGKERDEDPPHLIYLPERPFSEERFLADVRRAHASYGYVVVVVAETVRDQAGRQLGERAQQGTDAFGHKLLSGAAQYMVDVVTQHLGLRARFDKPGDLQRMSSASVSVTDRAEAEMVGRAAVREALSGATDRMITLVRRPGSDYACETGLTELSHVANTLRPLPPEYLAADGAQVTEAFRAYALPLIGEPLSQPGRLTKRRVSY